MLEGEKVESQVDQAEQPVTAEATHPADELVAAQPGAEQETPGRGKEPATPVKTYTDAEVTERLSRETATLQRQAAESEQRANRLEMQRQIDEAARVEAQAKAQDNQAVEQGIITQDDAARRGVLRQEQAQAEQKLKDTQRVIAQGEAKANVFFRTDFANDLAKFFKLDPGVLLRDESLRDPPSMIAKAAILRVKALEEEVRQAKAVPEHYDKGPGGGSGGGSLNTKEAVDKAVREIYDKD